jgi:predicted outer membrane protein
MTFGVEAKIPGKLAFLVTQVFVGKLLERSTAAADHEPMAPFFAANSTLNESTAGQNSMSQIEAAKQIEDTVDGNMIQIFALLV